MLDSTLNQGKTISLFLMASSIPFYVDMTNPEGEVTVTENTNLQIEGEFLHDNVEVMSGFVMPSPFLLEDFSILLTTLKNHEKRFNDISNRFEILLKRLEDLEKRQEKSI
ncbi:MAG: hypothetical protein QG670_1640 [Thermoproteota archaeon]|nr:hypothetical protein [Thermoproteota archaeon]